jgi:hypothetical protein
MPVQYHDYTGESAQSIQALYDAGYTLPQVCVELQLKKWQLQKLNQEFSLEQRVFPSYAGDPAVLIDDRVQQIAYLVGLLDHDVDRLCSASTALFNLLEHKEWDSTLSTCRRDIGRVHRRIQWAIRRRSTPQLLPQEAIGRVRSILVSIAAGRQDRCVSLNDVPEDVSKAYIEGLGQRTGSVFRTPSWESTGRAIRSTRLSNKGRLITVWKLKDTEESHGETTQKENSTTCRREK